MPHGPSGRFLSWKSQYCWPTQVLQRLACRRRLWRRTSIRYCVQTSRGRLGACCHRAGSRGRAVRSVHVDLRLNSFERDCPCEKSLRETVVRFKLAWKRSKSPVPYAINNHRLDTRQTANFPDHGIQWQDEVVGDKGFEPLTSRV